MSLPRAFLAAILCLVVSASASAQEDGYHAWLRAHLESEHGVTGGEWTLGTSEQAVLALAQATSGVTLESLSVTGEAFTSAHRYTITQPTAQTWHRTVRFHITEPVEEGNALLLAVWLRHTWPPDVVGRVEPVFEQAADPYTKSLSNSYSVPGDWGLYLIPFESIGNYAANEARIQFQLGFQRQMIELGGLAVLNFGTNVDIDELPTAIPPQVAYGGHSPDAPWRAEAARRIEEHRKGAIRIRVENADGEPVSDAEVQVDMRKHAFGFGTAISTGLLIGSGRNAQYRLHLDDLTGDGRTFNIAVLENALKWPAWEGNWPVSTEQKILAVNWLLAHGMDVRGHNLVWPGWEWLPDDIEANQDDPAYISDRIHDHIMEVAGHNDLKGVIRDWDVVNEPTHVTDLRDVFAGTAGHPTGEEVYAEWFEWARDADPEARLFVNDYSIISNWGPAPAARLHYKRIIRDLIDAGAPLDGIGMQGHMGDPLTPIDTLYKVLDEFGEFGLPISITEYDAAEVEEEIAGDYMRDFLTIVFSHPSVESFLMWGFWDGAHWLDDAPIFREDWSIKPSGEAFLDLVFDEWWTSIDATTAGDGTWMGAGFAGTYEVSATVAGELVSQEVEVSASDTTAVVLTLTTTGTADPGLPASFSIEPNFPDPAYDRTTIEYALPASVPVSVTIYDVVGRSLAVVDRGLQAAGRHEITLDVTSLPPGVYLYRMTAGEHHRTGSVSVLR